MRFDFHITKSRRFQKPPAYQYKSRQFPTTFYLDRKTVQQLVAMQPLIAAMFAKKEEK